MIQIDINNRSQICDRSVQFGLKKISDYATASWKICYMLSEEGRERV